MEIESFNALLRQLDMGDESALLTIQREYGKQIKWVAYSIINDWHHSRDILNEVLSTLWNKSKKFQNIENPDGCIYELAKKASYSFYRKYLKKQKNEVRLDKILEKDEARYLVHIDDYSGISFIEMISGLNETDKEIIIKKIGFNFTHTEIAKDLKMPEGTVKWKYQKILKKLREIMPDEKDSS